MGALVSVRNIVKRFAGTVALDGVSFDIHASQVHILLGENGAGKSTLMKILSGIYEPSEGQIQLGDTQYASLTPSISKAYGIALIYQELSVIDYLSIEENLFVGRLPTRKVLGVSMIDRALMHRKTRETLARIGLARHPATLVGELSISEKQQVEIAKALVCDARVIIMDEPTSSLTDTEVQHLFKVINELKSAGIGIVYISHKLKEIAEIGDCVSVLKDGQCVGTFDARTTPLRTLVASMVGREINSSRPDGAGVRPDERVLEVRHLSSRDGRVRDVSFDLFQGEILGFAGLMGAGRSELMEVIFGARARAGGTVTLGGREATVDSPYHAVKAGMAFVTEDRRKTGFFHNFSIAENISLVSFLRNARRQISLERIDRAEEQRFGVDYQQRLRIRCTSPEQNITELSGGNQQKAIIAKWLAADCELFIFDEPTRGIDIGAKSEIYQIMRDLANAGKGIVMVSSELPELLAVCDRIAVYKEGRIAEVMNNGDASEEGIMRIAMG
ncbi:sugar ABC transporter ATP-binding protein [Pseudomonas gingeri]|uniref:Sugar ABC transporter ATP-binding protein n=1 Tax=Pseudomonas gingeri TaxID=117681 RepID=A0A7Y7YDG7_9PSED|nr:sugar ABC transporter ATP-binding protein [Pseudomonas gingeri]NWA01555.1 sugar ABC transporter ATP-binding protein [Pseudomonas gingeri]NWA13642.1 sugar ABC transporter ATP-binding protein [Pseudomonas gingeri]NWA52998.1 sugar ABC transporter ATP-binding protein [Pseudomonas gingeri]NWA96495.1 sugar ABC transporter ATP-binding protein [Pseudomonas gingeri]NWA99868.1 sugar ABC transporter ATP-binding protein [Pseudomonas gingeri]